MNPAHDVAWVCQNQNLVIALLTWFMGVVPIASVASWWSHKMPPAVRTIVNAAALNLVHAVAGPPQPPPHV